MPMPKLFKRLSEKNLHKRAQSTDAKLVDLEPQAVPPLPSPKLPHRYNSYSTLETSPSKSGIMASPSMHSLPSLHHDSAEIITKNESPRVVTLPVPRTADQKDTMSDELVDAWNHLASKAPKANANKADRALEKIEGMVPVAQTNLAGNSTMVAGVTAFMDASGGMQTIEQGVDHFMEGITVLMNILDEVRHIHPCIEVAVLAFKAVYTLELNRRENDKKIIALYIEMKDMMTVLVQLKDVTIKDADEKAPDGTTITARLKSLADKTKDDIKACANTCDTYSKKKLVVKVLQSAIWQQRLVEFSRTFMRRRSEYEFALAIHTARGVDTANATLGDVNQTTQTINEKVDKMLELFAKFVPAEEKEMDQLIKDQSRNKIGQERYEILLGLQQQCEQKPGNFIPAARVMGRKGEGRKQSEVEDFKAELNLHPDAAIDKNEKVFSRKFEMQMGQISREIRAEVKHASDLVISAVNSGPHNKIIDEDVRAVWEDMRWRGSVKSRNFVMGLRDHFHDKWNVDHKKHKSKGRGLKTSHEDEWALACLTIIRLQAVSEAFDDDASGFVTVGEVNTFTKLRPTYWSLPHWLAYWAIGWHQTLSDYTDKIKNLLTKMFSVLPKIPKSNMDGINQYLLSVFPGIVTLQIAVKPWSLSEELQAKFKRYAEEEEARLKGNLEAVMYNIDAPDTLALVTGLGRIDQVGGRIDQFVLPLLYLLLKRHFEVFRICRSRRLHPDELDDAANTIRHVFDAVTERVTDLKAMFHQQKIDVKEEFQTFAYGLYRHYSESFGAWTPDDIKNIDYTDGVYDDSLEEQIDKSKVLHYPDYPLNDEPDIAAYGIPTPPITPISVKTSPLSVILGLWHGFTYDYEGASGMTSMDFSLHQITDEELYFQASGRNNNVDFIVDGKCAPGNTDDTINMSLTRTFHGHNPTSYWHGQLDISSETITGTCGFVPDLLEHGFTFILKRTAPEYLRLRPPPEDFKDNRPRALWRYACTAIKDHVHRKSMSWKFFKDRRDNRILFIELYTRYNSHGRPLNYEEYLEFRRLQASFTTADNRFYLSLAQNQIRRLAKHNAYCDHCYGTIGGARLICLTCQSSQIWNTIDLCETADCVAAIVGNDIRSDLPRPHLPMHDLVKVRQTAHNRQFVHQRALEALENARALFDQPTRSVSNKIKAAEGVDERPMSPEEKPEPTCISCGASVAQPCWYCVDCDGDVFICMSCDAAKGGVNIDDAPHNEAHALVRCQPFVPEVEALSVEGRLARMEKLLEASSVEDRLARLEKLLEASSVEDRLARVENFLEASSRDDRLGRIENSITAMLQKFGVEQVDNA